MAKYTELLADYLNNGGELPAVFNTIEGFADLFKGQYYDCEIGFETETLFQLKLESKANLIFPYYIKRIADLERAANAMANPQKVRNTTVNAGEQTSTAYTLPFNSTTAAPSAKQHNAPFENTDKSTESGYTPDEALRVQEYYNKGVDMILKRLLDDFKSLFMQVY